MEAAADKKARPEDFHLCIHDQLKKSCSKCNIECAFCGLRFSAADPSWKPGTRGQLVHRACFFEEKVEHLEGLMVKLQQEPTADWRHFVEIVENYKPPFAGPNYQPRFVVRFKSPWRKDGTTWFLRYSNGPGAGHFWDSYGDDYLNYQLAHAAILIAPLPPGLFNFTQHQPEGT